MFLPSTRFLVVDDFATMRKIIKKVLSDLSYQNIIEADDGKTAWPILEEAFTKGQPIDFIISDWNMPGMTGIELLKKCKEDPRFKSVPFLMVTAESEQKQILEAAKLGVSDYTVKPFNAPILKGKLERIWAKTNATKAA